MCSCTSNHQIIFLLEIVVGVRTSKSYLGSSCVLAFSDQTSLKLISTAHFVMKAEELVMLSSLATEAAELLWEMAVMQDNTEAAVDMVVKSEQLQVCPCALGTFSMQ